MSPKVTKDALWRQCKWTTVQVLTHCPDRARKSVRKGKWPSVPLVNLLAAGDIRRIGIIVVKRLRKSASLG